MNQIRRIPQGHFFHSLKWNFVLLSSLGIIAIALLGVILALIGRTILLEAERAQLAECTSLIMHGLAGDTPQTVNQTQVQRLTEGTSYRITIIALDGSVITDNEANPSTMENHGARPEVAAALRGKTDFQIRYSHTLSEDMLYVAQPWQGAILRVAMPLKSISKLLGTFFNGMMGVLAGATLVLVIVSWRMYSGIIIPIHRILDSTEAMHNSASGAQFHVSRPLELAAISRSLRQMAIDLNRQIAETSLRGEELQRLFEAIREPVFLLDHNQVIRNVNAAALHFLDLLENPASGALVLREADLLSRHLLTFIRCSELSNLIQESGNTLKACSKTVKLYGYNNQELGAYAAPIESDDPEKGHLFILVLYPENLRF